MKKFLETVRNLTKKDPKTIVERTLKGVEEFGELAEAVLSSEKVSACAHKNLGQKEVVEEGVDVLLVTFSVIFQANPNINLQDLEALMLEKCNKWQRYINK